MKIAISRKTILSIALIACLSACNSPEISIDPGIVTVSGQIIGRDSLSPQIVVVNFQNPFDNGGSSPVASLRPDGSFRVEYEMPYGQTINIRYGNRFINFYAEPGDNIGVTVDASQLESEDWDKVIQYSGDKSELNARFTPALSRLHSMHFWFDDKLSPDEFIKEVGDHLKTCRDSLAVYARRENLTKEEVRLLENEIMCSTLYYAAGWRDGEQQTETMHRLFTEEIDIRDSRYKSAEIYSTNVLGYMIRCLIDPALLEDPAAFMTELIRTMRNQPAGLARDIMVYASFAEFGGAFPDMLTMFASEARALLDSDYARVRFDMLTAQDVSELEPLPIMGISSITAEGQAEPLPEVDVVGYLAQKHPGKVIYIDIAAHWCIPCIVEIPHMKKLEESLSGEDVAFVALWLESDFDATVKLMREQELHGENYFFSADASRLFGNHYGVYGFPTYMLIDRSGKLVNRNAGRPSGERTAEQIRELLQ